MDPWGCFLLAVRFAGCMLLLVVLKFVAVFVAALLSMIFL
jgi:hypothetical protein